MSKSGARILQGLKDAVEGNIAAVTIDGVRWVREDLVKSMLERKGKKLYLVDTTPGNNRHIMGEIVEMDE